MSDSAWPMFGFAMFMLLSAMLGIAAPYLTGDVVDALSRGDRGHIDLFAAASLLSVTLTAVTSVARSRFAGKACRDLEAALRLSVFSHVQRLDVGFFHHRSPGEIISLLADDVENVGDLAFNVVLPYVSSVAVVVAAAASMCWANWRLFLVSVSVVPLWVALVRRTGKRATSINQGMRSAFDQHNALVSDRLSLSGVVRAKTYGAMARDLSDYSGIVRGLSGLNERLLTSFGASTIGTAFVSGLGPALLMLVGSYMVWHDGTSVGTIVAFIGLQARLYQPVQAIVGAHVQLPRFSVSLLRIFSILDLEPESSPGRVVADPGTVAYEDVTVQFGENLVLSNFSLEISLGSHVALVGRSGSGKTTVAQLIVRLKNRRSGSITIGGVSIDDIDLEALRAMVTYVPSESALFDGTVLDNVLYGADASDEPTILNACRIAQMAHDDEATRRFLSTRVGLGGATISSGERQRIMIARALLRRRPIFIFDESTSAVDVAAERAILESLRLHLRGCTMLWISHRLASLVGFESIVHLENGAIVEQGSFEQLASLDGGFAEMLGRRKSV